MVQLSSVVHTYISHQKENGFLSTVSAEENKIFSKNSLKILPRIKKNIIKKIMTAAQIFEVWDMTMLSFVALSL